MRAITRAQLLASWTSALDSAGTALNAALEVKAFDVADRKQCEQRLRAERDWLAGFERESALTFP